MAIVGSASERSGGREKEEGVGAGVGVGDGRGGRRGRVEMLLIVDDADAMKLEMPPPSRVAAEGPRGVADLAGSVFSE